MKSGGGIYYDASDNEKKTKFVMWQDIENSRNIEKGVEFICIK